MKELSEEKKNKEIYISNNMTEEFFKRNIALEATVSYFKDKQVSEEVFMRHLERVYNFLIKGNT